VVELVVVEQIQVLLGLLGNLAVLVEVDTLIQEE
jgi:hypothetical protein